MTDKDIIKALECASYYDCDKCPHHQENCEDRIADQYELSKDALDLINRLQAENENYSHNVKQLASDIRNYQVELQAMRNSANSFKSKYKSAVDTAKTLKSVIKEKDDAIESLTIKMNAFGLGMKSLKEDMEKAKADAIKEYLYKCIGEFGAGFGDDRYDCYISEDDFLEVAYQMGVKIDK